nr:phosphotransferase [Quadrisphaera sp. RL12-1S]
MRPVDLDRLRERLTVALGERAERLGVPGPLEELTGGWASTSVLACALAVPVPDARAHLDAHAADAPSTPAVLKLYAADRAGVEHAAREHRALDFLRGSACRVPAVLALELDPAVLGRPFLLMERAPGRSWWSAYESSDDDGERRRLVSSFVRPLVALHALDAHPLGPAATAAARGRGAADSELAGLQRDVAAFPRSGLGDVVGWLHAHRADLACERPVVQHRDYHPWNVLVDDDGEVCVLDWDWRVGDARFDVAWTCALVERSGHGAVSAAVREEYERQRGAPLHHLGTFEVLATVRWLLNVLPALGPRSQLPPGKREDFRGFLVEPLRRARELLRARTDLDAPLTT